MYLVLIIKTVSKFGSKLKQKITVPEVKFLPMFTKTIRSAEHCVCNCESEKKFYLNDIMSFNLDIKTNKKDINSNSKKTKSLEIRKEEVMAIRNRFPTKIPVVVQRFSKESHLPHLDKSKFLVPQEITMSQFLTIIRNRMRVNSTQTLYLLINNRSMISLSLTLSEVYTEYAGVDGFLYVTYASQEVFGFIKQSPDQKSKYEDMESNNLKNMEILNANESHFTAFFDNSYKCLQFG